MQPWEKRRAFASKPGWGFQAVFVSASVGVGVFAGYCACVRVRVEDHLQGPPSRRDLVTDSPSGGGVQNLRLKLQKRVSGLVSGHFVPLVCMERESHLSGLCGFGHPASVSLFVDRRCLIAI